MSGPVTKADAPPADAGADVDAERTPSPSVERHAARATEVGGLPVSRLLPKRTRRTVGAWCFVDHFGPVVRASMRVGPHPHIGLHTVTWLLAGEVLHTDSLGSEQLIRPGQLNLMTAGNGVAHAEESPADGALHGVQLWVAQPSTTRHGDPAFEHHAELPQVDLGAATATVLVGSVGSATSPARADTPLVGVAVEVHEVGDATLPLRADFEHAVAVVDGAVHLGDDALAPGEIAYLGVGRDALTMRSDGPATCLVLGGEPFDERLAMWWNFVARDRDEIAAAHADWQSRSDRFGEVASTLPRIDAPPLA